MGEFQTADAEPDDGLIIRQYKKHVKVDALHQKKENI